MNFKFSPEEQAFRREVRQFALENTPPEFRKRRETTAEMVPLEKAFATKMANKGWLGLGFPKEYGGQEGDQLIPMHEYILNSELMRLRAPFQMVTYLNDLAPVLLKYGSKELKSEILPLWLKAEIRWAIGYTEPEAGNDLAALQTKAVLDGDYWVINGQKRFCSGADLADYIWAAVRTDPDAPKHKGVSLMVIDTKLPGITITPMRMASGGRTNEVFFDDVKVPRKYLIGERGRGFYYMMEALDRERFTIIDFHIVSTPFEEFVDWFRDAELDGDRLKDDPAARHRVANMRLRMQAGKMMQLLAGARGMTKDYVPNVEAAAIRHWEGLTSWDKADLAMDLMRAYGCLMEESEDAPLEGRWPAEYKFAGHAWGSGGGVDINRKIVAQRGLGLPPW